MANNNGAQGGLLHGPTDKGGGKGIIASAPSKNVILGGGEVIINENAVNSTKTKEFNGSQKTNCEILSEINQETGGRAIHCPTPTLPKGEGVEPPTKFAEGGEIPKRPTQPVTEITPSPPERDGVRPPNLWHLTLKEFCDYAQNNEDPRLKGTKVGVQNFEPIACEDFWKYVVIKPLLHETAERNLFLLAIESGQLPYEKVVEILTESKDWNTNNKFVAQIKEYDRLRNYGAQIWKTPKALWLKAPYFEKFTDNKKEHMYNASIYRWGILDDKDLISYLNRGIVNGDEVLARFHESGNIATLKPEMAAKLNKQAGRAKAKQKLKAFYTLLKTPENFSEPISHEKRDAEYEKDIAHIAEKHNPWKFVTRLISENVKGTEFNKRSLEKLAREYGIMDQNTAKELAELSISIQARIITHRTATSEQKYEALVDLYKKQVNLSHRTSESIMLQQYSTPAPIGYLMGLYCHMDWKNNGPFFEPSAGNGLLTTAADAEQVVVNEIDKTRLANLNHIGFKEVRSQDATQPFIDLHRKFDAIVTNPPFGTAAQPVTFDGFELKSLEQIMAINGLECMKDTGRAAIIIGGHQQYDSAGRVKAGKNRTFFVYLYKHYNVEDVINIDGHALYSRQGTAFNTRLILINGRKPVAKGFPPLIETVGPPEQTHSPAPVKDFNVLYKRVNILLQPLASTQVAS